MVISEFGDDVLDTEPEGLYHRAVQEEMCDVFCRATTVAIRGVIHRHTMEALSGE